MATVTDVFCAQDSVTQVFSGVGQVILRPLSSGSYWLGGPSVSDSDGIALPNNENVILYITSPDTLYVYNENTSTDGYVRVYHNL